MSHSTPAEPCRCRAVLVPDCVQYSAHLAPSRDGMFGLFKSPDAPSADAGTVLVALMLPHHATGSAVSLAHEHGKIEDPRKLPRPTSMRPAPAGPRGRRKGTISRHHRPDEGDAEGPGMTPPRPSARARTSAKPRQRRPAELRLQRFRSHAAGSFATEAAGTGVPSGGCQPGPRNTRPTRSLQLSAILMSLAMAMYSCEATFSGLYVRMFLVSP